MKKTMSLLLMVACVLIFTGCSEETEVQVDLNTVMNDINTQCNITTTEELSIEDLNSYYYIEESQVKTFAAEIDTQGITEIVMVEATDEQAAASVAEQLEDRLSSKVSEAASYEAELLDIIKNSEVKTNGNYVSMIICEDVEKANSIYDEEFK